MVRTLDKGALPSPVLHAMDEGEELAISYTQARGQDVRSLPPARVRAFTTAASIARLTGEGAEVRALARDGRPVNERGEDGQYLHPHAAKVARACDALEGAERVVRFGSRRKAADNLVSANSGTQILEPSEEAVLTLPWRDVAPPGVEPEFGRTSMELSKISSFGQAEVRADMQGNFPQASVSLTPSTQRIGYFMIESATDPLRLAQARHGQLDLSGLLDMVAIRQMEHARGVAAYVGDSARGWSSIATGYATPEDKTSIAVDTATVAALLTGVQAVIEAAVQAAGDGYPMNYCQLAQDIMGRLRGHLDNGVSGIEFLRGAYPNITFTESLVLKTAVTADESLMLVGHRSGGGPNQPILGMQMLTADRDTVIAYADGVRTRSLRIAACAGSYSPYNELQLAGRFDTVA